MPVVTIDAQFLISAFSAAVGLLIIVIGAYLTLWKRSIISKIESCSENIQKDIADINPSFHHLFEPVGLQIDFSGQFKGSAITFMHPLVVKYAQVHEGAGFPLQKAKNRTELAGLQKVRIQMRMQDKFQIRFAFIQKGFDHLPVIGDNSLHAQDRVAFQGGGEKVISDAQT